MIPRRIEKDPIATAMRATGKSRVEILRAILASAEKHPEVAAKFPGGVEMLKAAIAAQAA